MKKVNRILIKSLFCWLIFFVQVESKIISIGNTEAKVKIKVFSSLTCPACANFHSKIFKQLKLDFIDKNLVKFEHHPFPLDLAALNAEIILRCHVDRTKRVELLDKMYQKQRVWAVGSDINKINNEIKKIGLEINLNNEKMNNCLENDKFQDEILNQRIEAQKKYKIESTPTIFINEKKYNGKIDYKAFKKTLERYL
jgi:protein-disulfide isomerase